MTVTTSSNLDVTGKLRLMCWTPMLIVSLRSLQATWIRNTVTRALRAFNAEAAAHLPSNFVFRAPTVIGMARLIVGAVHPEDLGSHAEMTRIGELQATVAKFTTEFQLRPASLHPRPDDGDVVFVTGTTGGFGCNILAQLSHDPSVKKIYAFNRPSDDIVPRQLYAMQKQGLLEECIRGSKFEMVEGDLSRPFFGLDPAVYEKVSNDNQLVTTHRSKFPLATLFRVAHHSQRYVVLTRCE